MRTCRVCKESKSESEYETFNLIGRRRVDGTRAPTKSCIRGTCRICIKQIRFAKYHRDSMRSVRIRISDAQRLNAWKASLAGTIDGFIYSHLHKWRKRSSVKSDLTFDYLKDLWNKQNGKCYYTNVDLTDIKTGHSKRHINGITITAFTDHGPSLDKIVPEKGYVKGNVVFCSRKINTTKLDRTPEQFLEVCRTVLEVAKNRVKIVDLDGNRI